MPDGDIFSKYGRPGFKNLTKRVYETGAYSAGSVKWILNTFIAPRADVVDLIAREFEASPSTSEAYSRLRRQLFERNDEVIDELLEAARVCASYDELHGTTPDSFQARIVSKWIRACCNTPELVVAASSGKQLGRHLSINQIHERWDRVERLLCSEQAVLAALESFGSKQTIIDRVATLPASRTPSMRQPNATKALMPINLLDPDWAESAVV